MDKAEILKKIDLLTATDAEGNKEQIVALQAQLTTENNITSQPIEEAPAPEVDPPSAVNVPEEMVVEEAKQQPAPTEIVAEESILVEVPPVTEKTIEEIQGEVKSEVVEEVVENHENSSTQEVEATKEVAEQIEEPKEETKDDAPEIIEGEATAEVSTSTDAIEEKEVVAKPRAKAPDLEAKAVIIEDLKKILKTDRKSLRKAYDKAKVIQTRWKDSGHNRTDAASELESKYKYNLELFYHNANITRQFIELDFDRNLGEKKKVIDKVIELQKEEDVEQVERKVSFYKKEFFRSGPVKREQREALKQELDAAVAALNDKIEAFYESRKELLAENLKKKVDIYEKLKQIDVSKIKSPKEFQEKTKAIQALQQEWRGVGRSLENDKVWGIFRKGCDNFFDAKREFFNSLSTLRKGNKEIKLNLIKEVEKLTESKDWKNTTSKIIDLQKQWKAAGSAQPAEDQRLWKKFRAQCDKFFNAKSAHYKELDSSYGENLEKKEALLKNIEAFKPGKEKNETIQALKAFEKEWQKIGYVPIKKKTAIQNAFRNAINVHYDALNLSRAEREKTRFESKIKAMGGQANNAYKNERYKLKQQLDRVETKLVQFKNNIQIFSGNPDNPIIKGIQRQIDDAQNQIKKIEQKMVMLNDMQNKAEFEKNKPKDTAEKEEE